MLLTCALHAQEPVAPPAETTVVEGRVVDMRGEGIPAAKVWISVRADPDQVLVRTIADGEGCFRIGRVPRRDVQVRARADGYCVAVGVLDENTTTVQLQQTATVKGVLRNRAGKPMADTVVRATVHGRCLWTVRCLATTDADGRFTLRDVPLAPIWIGAWIPGEGVADVVRHVAADTDVALQPGDGPTTAIAIAVEGMPEAAMATLRAGVMLQRSNGTNERLPPPLDSLRVPQGTLRLEPVPDASYRVSVAAPGWTFTPGPVELEPNRGPHTVKFRASRVDTELRSCPIEVRDTAGRPVTGVVLEMRSAQWGSETQATTDADGKAAMNTQLTVGTKATLRSLDDRWVTDQDGHDAPMTRDDLGRHDFVVDPTQTQQVRLVSACSVQGRLLRHDGRPASFVWVELQDQSSTRWPPWSGFASTTTDRDGRFVLPRLHHVDAAVRVSVSSPSGAWTGEPLDLSRPGTVIRLPEVKLAEPAIIEGVLRDANQRPVGGVRVQLLDWDMDLRQQRSGSFDETVTDRAGRYRFSGVAPGGAWLKLLAAPDDEPGREVSMHFLVEPGQVHAHDLELPSR